VVGDFNGWELSDPMFRISENGLWGAELPKERITLGQKYKYKILTDTGGFYKSDPYGACVECAPAAATVVEDVERYQWRDEGGSPTVTATRRVGIKNRSTYTVFIPKHG
jgi:1,4-alpha-glucan branching enzyme